MEGIFKKVYVILHTNPDGSTTDMGEANDQEALQKLYDTLNETVVLSIIDGIKNGKPISHVPKSKLRIRYCTKNGVYLQNIATEPVLNLTNTHDEFFRYYQEYKRSLYGDRAINLKVTDTLLMAIKEIPTIRQQIALDERTWFDKQLATSKENGTPLIVNTFPKFKSHEFLDYLLKQVQDALQVLTAASGKL